jgi:hypothetical protein
VPTKIDKVGRNQLSGRYREIINVLGLDSRTPFLPTSVRSRIGREDMQSWVAAVLAAADDPGPGGW